MIRNIVIPTLILTLIFVVPIIGQTRAGKFGIGLEGSGQTLLGAGTTNPSINYGGGFCASYSLMEYFGLRSKFIYNKLSWKAGNTWTTLTNLVSLNLYASADLMPNSKFNPFVIVGGGLTIFDPRNDNGTRNLISDNLDLNFIAGAGLDYFLNEFWSISASGEYVMTGSQYYAGSKFLNKGNDSFLRGSLQIRYYFFDQAFITKLLEAQRERYKRGQ